VQQEPIQEIELDRILSDVEHDKRADQDTFRPNNSQGLLIPEPIACEPGFDINESKTELPEDSAKNIEKIVDSCQLTETEFDLPGGRHFKGLKVKKKIKSGVMTWINQDFCYDGFFENDLP
jgi:hypothetical protein